jgi:Protein of unknown function (DUF2281)
MTIKELLFQEIESTPEELLKETLDFLQFLKTKQIKTQTDMKADTHGAGHAEVTSAYAPHKSIQSTGRSLLEHLKTIGTWEGDDAQLCLDGVYETRGKAKFDRTNPFDE